MARYSKEEHRGNVAIYGDDPGVYAYIYDGLALYFLGHPDRARRRLEEARTLAAEIDHPFTTVGAQAFSTQLLQFRRETDAVRAAAEKTIAQSVEQQFPLFVGVGLIHHGWSTVRGGDIGAGAAEIRQGIAVFRATGARLNVHYFLSELAEAHLAAGERAEGLAALDEALGLTADQLDRYYEAELHRLRGEMLLLAPSDVHAAETSFRRALTVSRAQGARALELRAATSLARLLAGRGERDEGRTLVAELYRGFSEGLDSEDLARARAFVDADL
jgi:adenylate cyclase